MDQLFNINVFVVAGLSFAYTIFCLFKLVRNRRHTALLLWPAVIYVIGPAATFIFIDHPVLSRYVDEKIILFQTALMVWYIYLFVTLDSFFGISKSLGRALNGKSITGLSSSQAFLPVYLGAVILAASLQIYTLLTVGSIFTGTYILESADNNTIPYWGFLAGLYEIIFVCFIVALLGNRPSKTKWVFYVSLYIVVAILRAIGGTRLVLIKEIAFIFIYLYLQGSIKSKYLIVIVSLVVAGGSLIGLARSGGAVDSIGFLGPVYGLVMESSLNSLTLSVATQVNLNGNVTAHADIFKSILFFLLSVVPSFARFGITDDYLQSISPYQLALQAGFDTSSPVGGMSGFATIMYVTNYPFSLIFGLIFSFCIYVRFVKNSTFKQMFCLLVTINSIHFWRDPSEIGFKLLVQGFLLLSLFYLIKRKRRSVSLSVNNRINQEVSPL